MTTHFVGFLSPIYTRTFIDSATGTILNLTGATNISMFMVNISNPQLSKQCTGTWTIGTPATAGIASYQWTTRDMDTAGNWLLYVSVQLASETTPRELATDLVSIDPDPSNANGGMIVSTQDINMISINGTSISVSNPLPIQEIEPAGYITASSPPSTTNAGSDTSYTFSSQVNRVIIQNNTSVNLYYAFDVVASAGSLVLLPGSFLIYPKKCTVLHLYTVASQNINGTVAGNIVVLGAN